MAAFILLPLLFSAGLQCFQLYLKQRASSRLERETLVQISVPMEKVQWVEEDHEVMIDKKMFDLKQWEEKDGMLVATGVWDEKETEVMGLLNGFNDGEQTGVVIRAMLLIQAIAFIIRVSNFSHADILLKKQGSFLRMIYLEGFHKKIYQPPRIFFFSFT